MEVGIGIIVYSGSEHRKDESGKFSNLPNCVGRISTLINSFIRNTKDFYSQFERYIVFDDNPNDDEATRSIRTFCRENGWEYNQTQSWGGPGAQVDRALREIKCNYVMLISDDVVVLKGWWEYTSYFLRNNQSLPIYMLTLPVTFVHRLHSHGLMKIEEFYSLPMDQVNPRKAMSFTEAGPPYIPCAVPHGSGAHFIINRDQYFRVGGVWTNNIVPEEVLGWKIWTQTEGWVIQFPAPPILHFENASHFGKNEYSETYIRSKKNVADTILMQYGLTVNEAESLMFMKMHDKVGGINLKRICDYMPIYPCWVMWPKMEFRGFEDLLGVANPPGAMGKCDEGV